MKNLHDYFQQHTDHTFAAAVRLLREHAPRAVTPRMLLRLEQIVLCGEVAGEYEWGKVRGALEASPPGPLSKRRGGDVEESAVDATSPPLLLERGLGGEARRLHKEHSHTHALLVSATTDAERAEYARNIMVEIIPALDAHYDALRAGGPESSGHDFDPISVSGGAPAGADLIRRLQSLRTRVSKITRHLLPAADTLLRKAELEKELETKRAEIARIEANLI
jgi:hypothetical protein